MINIKLQKKQICFIILLTATFGAVIYFFFTSKKNTVPTGRLNEYKRLLMEISKNIKRVDSTKISGDFSKFCYNNPTKANNKVKLLKRVIAINDVICSHTIKHSYMQLKLIGFSENKIKVEYYRRSTPPLKRSDTKEYLGVFDLSI